MDIGTQTETGLIYLLKDKTEKCYVGQTMDIYNRIQYHTHNIKNKNMTCSSRLLDIGFTYEILEDNVENDLLDLREQYWYDFYKIKCGDLLVNICRPLNTYKEYCEQHADEKKEKAKQYYKDHKDEIKEKAKQYKIDHKDELKDKAKQYYEDHKDIINDKAKQYNIDLKDELKEKAKQYYKDHKDKYKEYSKINKAKCDLYKKKYCEKNKEALKEKATEKINCECGGKYIRANKSTHFKTKKHIDFCGN